MRPQHSPVLGLFLLSWFTNESWREIGTEMPDRSSPVEYVAAVCHVRNGELEPYHTDRFFAVDDADAIQRATVWRVTAASTIDEKTWLRVMLNGSAIYSEDLGGF